MTEEGKIASDAKFFVLSECVALADDGRLRESLGKRARETVLVFFDERDYITRQVTAIERLLGNTGATVSPGSQASVGG